jgi:hypothetical protein
MWSRCWSALCVAIVCTGAPVAAQVSGGLLYRLETIGSDADDRARLAQLLGQQPTLGYLLRSPSSMTPMLGGNRHSVRWAVLAPEFLAIGNSSIPFSMNDGAMWAGRGWNESLRAGFHAEVGRLSVTVAPELLASENIGYELPPPEVTLPLPPDRSRFSSPWHIRPFSIDLPLRFGEDRLWRLDPGQTTLTVDAGRISVGLSSEQEWWGPGFRNAIVLSNNAPGIPGVFLRTTRPLETSIGKVEGRWFAGGLTESQFFDRDPTNNLRSIAGLGLVWTPRWKPNLSVGLARTVYAPVGSWDRVPLRLFDVFRTWGLSWSPAPSDSTQIPGRDQVYSIFGRWVFPQDGVEVYFEWARTSFPNSLRDLLLAPDHTRAYTVGLQWAKPVHDGRAALRLAGEATNLEKSLTYKDRPVATFYTSRRVIQGYTQRGQVIGAAIGPGSSSQWLGADYFGPRWRVAAFAGRIRWDDDALYFFPPLDDNKWCAHDVSLFAGISGTLSGHWGRVQAALTRGERLDMFFYRLVGCAPEPSLGILDKRNTTLELRFSAP